MKTRPTLDASQERTLRARAAELPGEATMTLTAESVTALLAEIDAGREARRLLTSYEDRVDDAMTVVS